MRPRKRPAAATFAAYFCMLFVAMLCLFLGVNGLIVGNNEQLLQDALSGSNRYTLERVRDMVDILIAESERAAYMIAAESDVEMLAHEDSFQFDQYEKIERLVRAQRFLELLTGTNAYIDSIYIYFEQSDYVCVSDKGAMDAHLFFDNGWLSEYSQLMARGLTFSAIRMPQYSRATSFPSVPSYYLTTYSPLAARSKRRGLVLVNTDIRALGNLFSDHAAGEGTTRLYITDAENRILFSQDDADVGILLDMLYDIDITSALESGSLRVTLENQPQIINAMASNYNTFRFYTINNMHAILQESRTVRMYAGGVLAVGACVLLLLSIAMAYRFYRPIRDVLTVLDTPSDWNARAQRGKRTAISEACDRIFYNIAQNEALERELTDRMQSLNSAQDMALRAQLNPHFLYNTLDAVSWKTRQMTSGENEASEMLTLLSQLLRVSLGSKEKLTTLRQEMDTAALYLRINEIRKPGRFSVCWTVDEALQALYVPPMILQPLLENAVLHGFAGVERGGLITVSASESAETLLIEVHDNGRGMDAQQLAQVRERLLVEKLEESEHIGLLNVHRRIQLTFGAGYGLTLESQPQDGTCVSVHLPRIAYIRPSNPAH